MTTSLAPSVFLLTVMSSLTMEAKQPVLTNNIKLPISVKVDILNSTNGSYVLRVDEWMNGNASLAPRAYNKNKDHQGAVMYVCAVILMYGFSIVFMIGSLVKKSMSDQRVRRYMKALDDVRRYEKRMETYKASMIVNKKQHMSSLGLYTGPGSLSTVREQEPCEEDLIEGGERHDETSFASIVIGD